jgi:hypothetical protein
LIFNSLEIKEARFNAQYLYGSNNFLGFDLALMIVKSSSSASLRLLTNFKPGGHFLFAAVLI